MRRHISSCVSSIAASGRTSRWPKRRRCVGGVVDAGELEARRRVGATGTEGPPPPYVWAAFVLPGDAGGENDFWMMHLC